MSEHGSHSHAAHPAHAPIRIVFIHFCSRLSCGFLSNLFHFAFASITIAIFLSCSFFSMRNFVISLNPLLLFLLLAHTSISFLCFIWCAYWQIPPFGCCKSISHFLSHSLNPWAPAPSFTALSMLNFNSLVDRSNEERGEGERKTRE